MNLLCAAGFLFRREPLTAIEPHHYFVLHRCEVCDLSSLENRNLRQTFPNMGPHLVETRYNETDGTSKTCEL